MAKGSRGGRRSATGAGGAKATLQDDNQQPIQQQQAPQSISADFNKFMSMTDDEKADAISNYTSQGVPSHLSQTDFQSFIYNMGLNDKPQLVDDTTLDSMKGKELFRTVNNVYDSRNDIGYSAKEIAKQVQSGSITRTSDNGGSVYGRGIYFADNKGDSTAYGNTFGNVNKTAVIRCKLNDKANVVDYYSALNGYHAEVKSGSKLGKALSKLDGNSGISVYALSKGYNVITNGRSYFNVLNRQAVTMSKTVNPM